MAVSVDMPAISRSVVTPSPQAGLSLSQAVAVGVNTTSPAYSLAAVLAPMAALVGYATPIALVVSFIPMALTSLAFMYLNRRDPDCGTTFSWVTKAMGGKTGFVAGWVIAATGVLLIGSLAETAISYLMLMLGQGELAENRYFLIAASACLILVMVGLAIRGSDSSVKMQTVITYIQVMILLGFGVAAAFAAYRYGLPGFSTEWINPLYHGPAALVGAMLLGVFAFWGWEAATNLSEECRNPRDAGKAGVISTVILLGTYLTVAISVVLYLGQSDFYPVGESGLVLVDMSASVFGVMAFLVLLAVAMSALASTQSSMLPGSRAVLSMARRGALPEKLGLMHPRFKSPYVSLALLAGLSATWYVSVSLISESAMTDTLSSLGILVAFYYSVTGMACVIYYRRHITASLKGFLFVGLGPTVGSLGLAAMLVVAIQSLSDPATSASGSSWLGLAPPLTIAGLVVMLGISVMFLQWVRRVPFFRASQRELADQVQSPFLLDSEREIPSGGIVIDCNVGADAVIEQIREAVAGVPMQTPVYLVYGIQPAGLAGEEYSSARTALIGDAGVVFASAAKLLRESGFKNVFRFYVEEPASAAVEAIAEKTGGRITV